MSYKKQHEQEYRCPHRKTAVHAPTQGGPRTLVVGGISLLHHNPRVDDRYEAHARVMQLLHKSSNFRLAESNRIICEIPIRLQCTKASTCKSPLSQPGRHRQLCSCYIRIYWWCVPPCSRCQPIACPGECQQRDISSPPLQPLRCSCTCFSNRAAVRSPHTAYRTSPTGIYTRVLMTRTPICNCGSLGSSTA